MSRPRHVVRDGALRAIGVASLLAAAWACSQTVVPEKTTPRAEPDQPPVGLPEDSHLSKDPARKTKGLDLVKLGWTYDCMECHRTIAPKWRYDRPMVEHRDVALAHGNNRFCLNCHHPTNRNAFVDYDGSEIPEREVVSLCARCHGPKHRDWLAGAHGRANGYWDPKRGKRTRLSCIQCHDPHDPKFKPMTAAPGLAYPVRAARSKEKAKAGRGHAP